MTYKQQTPPHVASVKFADWAEVQEHFLDSTGFYQARYQWSSLGRMDEKWTTKENAIKKRTEKKSKRVYWQKGKKRRHGMAKLNIHPKGKKKG